MDSAYLLRLACVKRTQIQMMVDRGFSVPPQELALLDKSPWAIASWAAARAVAANKAIYEVLGESYAVDGSTVDGSTVDGSTAGAATHVVYLQRNYNTIKSKEKMTSSDHLKAILTDCEEAGMKHVILIVPTKLSHDAREEVSRQGTMHVEVLLHSQMLFPVSKHVLVPHHVRLTEAEAKDLLSTRGISREQLPCIKTSDPVAQYFGYKVGDIVASHVGHWRRYRVVKA